jgi:hypothetical protein
VVVEVGKDKRKTRVHQEGGKKPHWEDKFSFANPKANMLKVTVWD